MAAGFLPVVYDNLSTGLGDFVRRGPFVDGDLLDRETLPHAFAEHCPAMVLRFATCTYVGESFESSAKYCPSNVIGALRLLDATRSTGNVPIVFSSTCAVYGEPDAIPITENAVLAPVNPYGRTKLAVEHALADYEAAYGLHSVRLRYFNASGCDPDGEVGESHEPETHLIPRAILAAMGHLEEVAVNLGTGRGFSVREVVDAVERVTGLQVPSRVAARRQGDPAVLVADGSRARRLLGFTAPHADLETIVRTAHAWLARNDRSARSSAQDGASSHRS